ncbi:large ribosomal subunit protein eL18-like [Vicia villosa]|uniref:large ribosomal subunit protein eL18-like n=1 Tax=Vicia villosa TaxID=3911 RepID=UPI00273C6433|nr:large ribosomal subunit protein eL18-like [Vicia villosa]
MGTINLKADGNNESDDIYLKLLIKVYRLLVRKLRRESKFNRAVLDQLIISKDNQLSTISLTRLIDALKDKEGKIGVVAGVVTDLDSTVHDVPAIKVAAISFTATARARIESAGGECLIFDQLPFVDIFGHNSVLVMESTTSWWPDLSSEE